jgi:hypothetical protein
MDFRWIKFFRDDGIFIFSGGGSQLVFDILDILNGEREELQFTTELCLCGNVLGCCQSCPKAVPYLENLVSVYEELLKDGSLLPQIKNTTYSNQQMSTIISILHLAPPTCSASPQLLLRVWHTD